MEPLAVGAAVFDGACDSGGGARWSPSGLQLRWPVLLGEYRDYALTWRRPSEPAPFAREVTDAPLREVEKMLVAIRDAEEPVEDAAQPVRFPVAVLAATFEFGRYFAPHRHAFRRMEGAPWPELFIAIHRHGLVRREPDGEWESFGNPEPLPLDEELRFPRLDSSANDPAPAWHGARAARRQPLQPALAFEEYARRVERIRALIAAGDLYQANMTMPWHGATDGTPESLFAKMQAAGGAPFAGMLRMPGAALLSQSPELLLRRRGDLAETRPIKGTARIDGSAAEAQRALLASQKDRAEHVMIVDLERNDLGRIARSGTVAVEPFLEPVAHRTLVHLESTVRATLRPQASLHDLFAATFPGGSVSGAPKRRALEVLRDLEAAPRGFYCGAFGWVDAASTTELNLPIRTAYLRHDGTVRVGSGGGIVWESDPTAEWAEIETKLRLFRDLFG